MRGMKVMVWLALVIALGCGEDGTSMKSDSGGASGTAGGTGGMQAGTGGGGTGSVPTGGGGTGTGSVPAGGGGTGGRPGDDLTGALLPKADLCMPGDYFYMKETPCRSSAPIAAGIPDKGSDILASFGSIALPAPMTPGKPYTISIEAVVGKQSPAAWHQEIWGVMSLCAEDGEQADLLVVQMLDRGPYAYCSMVMPTKAYTHIIQVVRKVSKGGSFGQGGFQFCPTGSCPKP
jgi:hypothetical protein